MEASSSSDSYNRHGSPSSKRLLGFFNHTYSNSSSIMVDGGDMDERDVFWSGRDFSHMPHQNGSVSSSENNISNSFHQNEIGGILAALREDNKNRVIGHYRRRVLPEIPASASHSSSRMIPSIPKPQAQEDFLQSVPTGRSAPVNVPINSRPAFDGSWTNSRFLACDDDEKDEEEMVPPHEMVARSLAHSPLKTFSVLEGRGRTLKGRDLRQVRNAVLRQTGFLD